jgi:hypothetical protein
MGYHQWTGKCDGMCDSCDCHLHPARARELREGMETVYFRRSPHESEDRLSVPKGTAHLHVRPELITRVVPG